MTMVVSVDRSRLQCLTFIFMHGHAGIKGNERSDSVASTALMADGQAMDRDESFNAI